MFAAPAPIRLSQTTLDEVQSLAVIDGAMCNVTKLLWITSAKTSQTNTSGTSHITSHITSHMSRLARLKLHHITSHD